VSSPAANAIPKANGDGVLDDWISPASETVSGIVELATGTETDAGKAIQANDPRIPTQDENDALTGTGTPASGNPFVTQDTFDDHSARHEAGGADEITVSTTQVTGTMPVDKGGTNTTSLTGDRVLKSASDGLSVEPLTGTGVLKLTSDAPTVAALGTADLPTIPVSGGGTGATTAAAARTALVVVQKGASGRDEAQVTKLYDSSGNVIAEINGSGGLDVGSPTTSAGADDLAVEGGITSDGDMFPSGFVAGIAERFVDIQGTVSDHFRSGSMPAGFSWTTTGSSANGETFGTPASIEWSRSGDALYIDHNVTGASAAFLQRSSGGTSGFEFTLSGFPMKAVDGYCEIGVRIDNGAAIWQEMVVRHSLTDNGWRWITRSNAGDSTVSALMPIPIQECFGISIFGGQTICRFRFYKPFDLSAQVDSITGVNATSRMGLVFYSSTQFGRAAVDWILF
jgi:hypothetical protein